MTHSYVARLPAVRPRSLAHGLRFGLVGVAGVAVNVVGLHLLYGLAHVPLVLASTLAVELAIVHNYLLNDWWTFRRPRPSLRRFARFNLSSLLALVVNVAVVWVLVGSGLAYTAANLVAIACGAGFNFKMSSGWVWRGPR